LLVRERPEGAAKLMPSKGSFASHHRRADFARHSGTLRLGLSPYARQRWVGSNSSSWVRGGTEGAGRCVNSAMLACNDKDIVKKGTVRKNRYDSRVLRHPLARPSML